MAALNVIKPQYNSKGEVEYSEGTIAAGYQNFFICIEMLLASIALRFAFSVKLYAENTQGACVVDVVLCS